MTSINIHALADRIRDRVDPKFASKIDPETRHLHDTAVAVARHLGMHPDALTVEYVTSLLRNDYRPPAYPKMKYHHEDRVTQTVVSEEEERALGPGWVDDPWNRNDP